MKRLKTVGDVLINPKGEELTIIQWIPGDGLYVIGKWLCKDRQGKTIRLYSTELAEQGFDHKP